MDLVGTMATNTTINQDVVSNTTTIATLIAKTIIFQTVKTITTVNMKIKRLGIITTPLASINIPTNAGRVMEDITTITMVIIVPMCGVISMLITSMRIATKLLKFALPLNKKEREHLLQCLNCPQEQEQQLQQQQK